VGNGGRINFWHDSWLGEEPLASSFPEIFMNSEQKEEIIGNMGVWGGDMWRWELLWRLPWFEWKMLMYINVIYYPF